MRINIEGEVVAVTEDKRNTPVVAIKLGEREYQGRKFEDIVAVRCWHKSTAAPARELQPGARVKASADVKSREWQGRWYTDVDAFKLEVVSKGAATHRKVDAKDKANADDDDGSGIPF